MCLRAWTLDLPRAPDAAELRFRASGAVSAVGLSGSEVGGQKRRVWSWGGREGAGMSMCLGSPLHGCCVIWAWVVIRRLNLAEIMCCSGFGVGG